MIYEYKCSECKEIWEEVLPLSKYDKPMKNKCPHCDAKKGSVYRHIGTAPAMKMDYNMDIKKPHNMGGFEDAMRRMVESPGVKGTPEAEIIKGKHLS
jgi:putative FmdB family regulatory protein